MAIDNVGTVRLQVEAYLDPKSLRRVESAVQQHGRSAKNLGNAYKRPLGEITGQVTEFSKSLDASNARVLAFGASAGAIMGLQRAFSFLLDSMIKVEKELKDINVILGANKSQLQGFSKELFNVAGATGQSFETVAIAAKELSRQGLSMEKTLLRTRDALILTRLSGMDAESAVASLTAAINTFNRSALNSTQIVNKMANVDAAFAVSTKDLAEAMKRVGSTAQDVQVDFDQLMGAVSSLQQTTARGGPVIGNGLKSIFTRIQRTNTLDQLEALNISVRNMQGEMLPAMMVLGNLAKKFPQLTKAQQAHTSETVAGVFQMNTLRALLNDLGKSNSAYARAVRISSSSTNEAIARNEELNKTLDAQIIKLKANAMQAAKGIGGMILGPSANKIIGGLNEMFDKGNVVNGEGLGVKVAKGMLKGIGAFLTGPGLALIAVIGIKLGGKLLKFIRESAMEMMNLQTHAMKIASTEKLISAEIAKQPGYLKAVSAGLITRRALENGILQVLQQQALTAKEIAMFSATTAKSVVATGGGTTRGGTFNPGTGRPRTKSRGHIPNYNRTGSEIIGAISGGYMPGAVRQTNIAGLGNVTYNTAEKIKHVPGFAQPFINPPQHSSAGKQHKANSMKQLGMNPYSAAGGSVPNYSRIPIHKQPTFPMQQVLEFLRKTAGKSSRQFGITYMKGGEVKTIGGRQAGRSNFGIGGKESHSQFDLSGDYKYFRFKKKMSDPGWAEIKVKDILGLKFDKREFTVDQSKDHKGPPSLRMTKASLDDQLRGGLSGGHVPNFARVSPSYGSFNVGMTSLYGARPTSPTSGGPGASGLYPRYASSSFFSRPSKGSAGQLGENTAQAYSLIGKILTGFNMKMPIGLDRPGMGLGPGGALGGSSPLASYLSAPVSVNSQAFQKLLSSNPAKADAIRSAANGVSTQEFFQRLNTKIKPTSKSSGAFYEDLLFASRNPNIGPRFSGTEKNVGAGLDPVEGALRHGGKWFPMDVKSTATLDARATLGGKAMQSFPSHYRRVVQDIAQWKNEKGLGSFSSNDTRIIDDFFNARSGVGALKTPVFQQAFDNARDFMGSRGWRAAAGGSIPNFAPMGPGRQYGTPISRGARSQHDPAQWDISLIKGKGGLKAFAKTLKKAQDMGQPIRTIDGGEIVGPKVFSDLLANPRIVERLKKFGVRRFKAHFKDDSEIGGGLAEARARQPDFDKIWGVKKLPKLDGSAQVWTMDRTLHGGLIPNFSRLGRAQRTGKADPNLDNLLRNMPKKEFEAMKFMLDKGIDMSNPLLVERFRKSFLSGDKQLSLFSGGHIPNFNKGFGAFGRGKMQQPKGTHFERSTDKTPQFGEPGRVLGFLHPPRGGVVRDWSRSNTHAGAGEKILESPSLSRGMSQSSIDKIKSGWPHGPLVKEGFTMVSPTGKGIDIYARSIKELKASLKYIDANKAGGIKSFKEINAEVIGKGSIPLNKLGFAGGHVPNFADPMAAAFAREKKASGLPPSQIYATSVHTPNYSGPVVGNMRDEPNKGSLRNAVMNHPNPARAGLSDGFVPNFNPLLNPGAQGAAVGYGQRAIQMTGWDAALTEMNKNLAVLSKEVKTAGAVERSSSENAKKAVAEYKEGQRRLQVLEPVGRSLEKLGNGQAVTIAEQRQILTEFKSAYGAHAGTSSYERTSGPRAGETKILTTSEVNRVSGTLRNMIEGTGSSRVVKDLFRGGYEAAETRDQSRSQRLKNIEERKLAQKPGFESRDLRGKTFAQVGDINARISTLQAQQAVKITPARTADLQRLQRAQARLDPIRAERSNVDQRIAARSAAITGQTSLLQGRLAEVMPSRESQSNMVKLQENRDKASKSTKERKEIRREASKEKAKLKTEIKNEKARSPLARNAASMASMGMTLGFAAPMAGHMIAGGINQNTKSGRVAAANVTGAASTLGMVGMGAMIGSSVGPAGTAVGAGVGAAIGLSIGLYSWLTGATEAAKSTLDDLRNVYSEEVRLKQEAANATGIFVKSQQDYIEAISRGAGATTLASIQRKGTNALADLRDPKEIQKLVVAASTGDMKTLQDTLSGAAMRAEDSRKVHGEGGVLEKAVTIGKDERFTGAQLLTMAQSIARHGGGTGGEAMTKLKTADMFYNFRKVGKGHQGASPLDHLEGLVRQEENLLLQSKNAAVAINSLAGSIIKLKFASVKAGIAKEAEIKLSEAYFAGSLKNQEAIGKLAYNVSTFAAADKQLDEKQQRTRAGVAIKNVAAYQRTGAAMLQKGTAGITSGTGTSGQQAMANLGRAMMMTGPGGQDQLYKAILGDPDVDSKTKLEIQGTMDKLATQMAINTAAAVTQNQLLRINNVVQKSNADFRQRMKMESSSFGGQGPEAFFSAIQGFSGGNTSGGTFSGRRAMDTRMQSMRSLESMGFDLDRGGMGDLFRQTKRDRFKARGGQMLDSLVGGKHSTALQGMNLKDAEAYLRGGGKVFGPAAQSGLPMSGGARMADRPISQHGDLAFQILKTMKSGEIDAERKAAEGRIKSGQTELQGMLVAALSGSTQMTAALIDSNVALINAQGDLAGVIKTLPLSLGQQMKEIATAYSLSANRSAAGGQLTTMMSNDQRRTKLMPRAYEAPSKTIRKMKNQGAWGTKGTGEEDILRSTGYGATVTPIGVHASHLNRPDKIPIDSSVGKISIGGAASRRGLSPWMFDDTEDAEDKYGVNEDRLQMMMSAKFANVMSPASNPRIKASDPMGKKDLIPAQMQNIRHTKIGIGKPEAMGGWINDFRTLMSSDVMQTGDVKQAVAQWFGQEGYQGNTGLAKAGLTQEQMVVLVNRMIKSEAGYTGGGANPSYKPQTVVSDADKLVNTLTQGGNAPGGVTFGAETNVSQLVTHLTELQRLNATPGMQKPGGGGGMLTPQINKLQAHIKKQNPASQGFSPAAGGTWRQGKDGSKNQTPSAVTGLQQVAKNQSARVKAMQPQMNKDMQLLNELSQLPTGLRGIEDLSGEGIGKYYEDLFQSKRDYMSQNVNLQKSMALAQGQDPRGVRLQAETDHAAGKVGMIDKGIGNIVEKQLDRQSKMAAMGFTPEQIAEVQAGKVDITKTPEYGKLKDEDKRVVSSFAAGEKQIGALKGLRPQAVSEVEKKRIDAYALEIKKMQERSSLIDSSNGHLALGTTNQGQLNEIKIREIDELMKNIPLLEQDSTKTEELAASKKELAQKLKELPIDKFKEETERLNNTLSQLNLELAPENRAELFKQFGLTNEINEGQAREDQLRALFNLKDESGAVLRTQKLGEQTNILKAEQNLKLGTGTGRQLAGAKDAADMAAFRRGDMNMGETLERQMKNKVKASQTDWKEDLMADVAKLSESITGSFETAWDSWITGSKSGKDAFKAFAAAVAMDMQRILFRATVGKVIENVISGSIGMLSGGLGRAWTGSKGGLVPQRFNEGGFVQGGSGYKDDVPAMMSGGEFVMRRSAVNKYGPEFMQRLNDPGSADAMMFAKGGEMVQKKTDPKRILPEVNWEDKPSYAGRSGVPPAIEKGRNRGFKQQLDNQYLMNDPDRPGKAKYNVDKRLSNFAQFRDDSNVQSKFRQTRQDKFLAYEDFLKMETDRRVEAQAGFEKQRSDVLKAGRLNAIISAAAVLGGEALGKWAEGVDETNAAESIDAGNVPKQARAFTTSEGNTFIQSTNGTVRELGNPVNSYGNMGEFMSSNFADQTFTDAWKSGQIDFGMDRPDATGFRRGGVVKRFANGGMNRDSVPAMLMGGEYVLNKESAQTYGTEFLNRLNGGKIPTFQNGGTVGGGLFETAGAAGIAGGDPEKVSQLVDLAENINRMMEESTTKDATKEKETEETGESGGSAKAAGGMVNNISITVNSGGRGGGGGGEPTSEVEASTENQSEESGGSEQDTGDLERNEKLADSLRGVVLDTIVKEQRPGGLLHDKR